MKKIILVAMLAIAAFSSRQAMMAQVTLEHTYDSATTQLYVVHLEVEGDKYIWRNYYDSTVIVYNLDHSIFKIMPFPNVSWNYMYEPSFMYVSEQLFNTDNLIEYMFCYYNIGGALSTIIINEVGTIIFFADSLAPLVKVNAPQSQLPIYNTSNGTKMILSSYHRFANVYSLTGTLTNSIRPLPYSGDELAMENIYPNPSNGNSMIEFHLPQGVSTGEIVVYNTQGAEMKRYKVDNTFHNLIISNSELHSGTYFYQLFTSNAATGAKKMIVVK